MEAQAAEEQKSKLGPWEQTKLVGRAVKKLAFKTDGCTASPDLTFRDCCEQHDRDYYDQNISRVEADKRLRDCMRKDGYMVLPWLYYAAVRLFGGYFWDRHRGF